MLALEEWNKIFEDLLKSTDDQAALISGLTRARDEYGSGYAELEEMKNSKEKLESENNSLRKTNMELFLRIGRQAEADQTTEDKKDDDRSETITISELLKEELK